jgi:imidazole glycerol-phosphate synthase subunit HisH
LIAILDYGMGNLRSVEKALARVGADAVRTDEHDTIRRADGIVLPGVGAFPEAMSRMDERGLSRLVRERAEEGVPLLGICLGMQLLFDSTTELGGGEGLGLLPGSVGVLKSGSRKIPHIGWSPVRWEAESPLTRGIESEEPFYLVHSFAPRPAVIDDVLGTAEYGERFTCAVQRRNVFGFQFHPEKSSGAGLRLLENFAAICAPVPA